MRLLESLLVGLGYDYNNKGLKDYEADVETVKAGVAKLAKVAVGAATSLTALVVASTGATDSVGKMAGEVRVSVDMIDALNFALERSGGTAAGMESSLRGIARRASEASRGVGESVQAFGLLGIQVTDGNGRLKQSDTLLKEVANSMQGLTAGKQLELAEKLGVSGSIRLLQHGGGEIDKLVTKAKALGTITEEDAAIAATFQDALTDLWRVLTNVGRTITRQVAPAMSLMVNNFNDWYIINKDIIDLGIELVLKGIGVAASNLQYVLIALGAAAVIKGLAMIASLLKVIRVRFLLATVAALLLPALVGAAIVAVIALIEDAYGHFNGKESLLGNIIGDYPEYEAVLNNIGAAFAAIGATVVTIVEGWREIISLAGKFSIENLKEVGGNVVPFLLDSAGLQTVEGDGLLDFGSKAGSNPTTNGGRPGAGPGGVFVDRIDISVNGGGDPATAANATREALEQSYDTLRGNIDQ